ncbi:MAG: nuclear transport factor 2 family protein [Eudoraea sp.]|nr:nuclear transport factor 2 family protein [Eudoraea sp.]MBT8321098.1 nuclear transport factor 2 family protein [Eudoraea sp.]
MGFCDLGVRYIEVLQEGNLQGILELFASDAQVVSPVYGRLDADKFYTSLLADTQSSQLQLHHSICDKEARKLAVYFTYHWTLKDDSQLIFDVVDILLLDNNNKIKGLTIVYDSRDTSKKIASLRQQE